VFTHRRTSRVITAVAASIATMGLIAGCSAGTSSKSPSTAKAGGTITTWEYYTTNTQVANMKAEEAIYTKAHPGVKFSNVYIPYADMDNRLIAAAQTNTGPDLILAEGADAQSLVQAGTLSDMTKCVASWDNVKAITPAAYRMVGKKVYGVLPYLNLIALWYNKDILDAAGVKAPTTFAQLQTDLAAVTAKGDKGIVFAGDPNFEGAWTSRPIFTALGVNYPKVSSASMDKAFTTVSNWLKKGWVPPDVANMTQPDAMNEFLTGKYGFGINGNWTIGQVKTAAKFNYGVPSGTSNSQVYVSGETAMIGAFAKNKAQVCDYLNSTWFSKQGSLDSFTSSGSLPVLTTLFNSPKIKNDPLVKPFAAATKTGTPSPGGKLYTFLNTVWGPAFSQLFAGGDPKSISDQLYANVKSQLGGVK
jgi:multiple sugar transport system substrate-binding protein